MKKEKKKRERDWNDTMTEIKYDEMVVSGNSIKIMISKEDGLQMIMMIYSHNNTRGAGTGFDVNIFRPCSSPPSAFLLSVAYLNKIKV